MVSMFDKLKTSALLSLTLVFVSNCVANVDSRSQTQSSAGAGAGAGTGAGAGAGTGAGAGEKDIAANYKLKFGELSSILGQETSMKINITAKDGKDTNKDEISKLRIALKLKCEDKKAKDAILIEEKQATDSTVEFSVTPEEVGKCTYIAQIIDGDNIESKVFTIGGTLVSDISVRESFSVEMEIHKEGGAPSPFEENDIVPLTAVGLRQFGRPIPLGKVILAPNKKDNDKLEFTDLYFTEIVEKSTVEIIIDTHKLGMLLTVARENPIHHMSAFMGINNCTKNIKEGNLGWVCFIIEDDDGKALADVPYSFALYNDEAQVCASTSTDLKITSSRTAINITNCIKPDGTPFKSTGTSESDKIHTGVTQMDIRIEKDGKTHIYRDTISSEAPE